MTHQSTAARISSSSAWREVPLYLEDFTTAKSKGEAELYWQSCKANQACADFIIETIYRCYHNYSLDTKAAALALSKEFGLERTAFLLAVTIRQKSADARISQENLAWAQDLNVGNDESTRLGWILDAVHPGLLNLLASAVRKELPGKD